MRLSFLSVRPISERTNCSLIATLALLQVWLYCHKATLIYSKNLSETLKRFAKIVSNEQGRAEIVFNLEKNPPNFKLWYQNIPDNELNTVKSTVWWPDQAMIRKLMFCISMVSDTGVLVGHSIWPPQSEVVCS